MDKSFSRVLKYVWPQWPRIIVVVITALIVSILLSMSFMTIIPLLKVMMGEEGIHGWTDRKIISWRYGIESAVTNLESDEYNAENSLVIIKEIKDNSPADKAGLKPQDVITGIGQTALEQTQQIPPFYKLLHQLSQAPLESAVDLRIRRFDENAQLIEKTIPLSTTLEPAKGYQSGFTTAIKQKAIDFTNWGTGFFPRERTPEAKTQAIVYIIVLMVIITIIRCTAKFYQGYMAQKVVQVGLTNLRDDIFSHIMLMPIGFFMTDKPSDTVSKIIRDTGVMGKAIKILLGKALREPLNALFFLMGAMILNWQLTLIFLGCAPPTAAMLSIFGRKMKKATKKSLISWSDMLSKLQETLQGLRVVKVYNQQGYEQQKFKNINRKLLKQLLKISKVDAMTNPVMEVLGMVAGSAALIVGAHYVTHSKVDASQFLVLLILLGSAAEAIRKTSDIWNKIQEANAASERVFTVMDEPLEYENSGKAQLPPLSNNIEFRNIVFRYPKSHKNVLNGIDLKVRAGQNVAIVGPNGSGKTTLVNLIPRFFNPDEGSILIDGEDIKEITLSSLREQIAMVTQNVVTFNESIAANIAYSQPDAPIEKIIAAAKRAFAHEFIEPLPDGYDTIIGEQGSGLSGGQLQRIVIARAILKNPKILIFDEATSQIDADSEAKIHKAIEEILHNRTSFIIAHRFSTIINSDVIVVMDQGKIIAKGKHEELIQSCSLYQSLYETQIVKD